MKKIDICREPTSNLPEDSTPKKDYIKRNPEVPERSSNTPEIVTPEPSEDEALPAKNILRDSAPYPALDIVFDPCKNNKVIRTLKKLYAANQSELTAITTYLYQSFIVPEEMREIGESMERIAEAEMYHLQLLGKAIVQSGGDPTYTNGLGISWSGRFPCYEKDVSKFLQCNIKNEEEAIRAYQAAALTIGNSSLAALFLRIILDEQLHIKELRRLLHKYFGLTI